MTNTQRILGYLVAHPEQTNKVASAIFTDPREKKLFTTLKEAHRNNEKPGLAELALIIGSKPSELMHIQNEGLVTITELTRLVQSELKLLKIKTLVQSMSKPYSELTRHIRGEAIDLEQLFQQAVALKEAIVGTALSDSNTSIINNPQLTSTYFDHYVEPIELLPTGIDCIDRFIGGLGKGMLSIVIASTGVGKTNLLLNITRNLLLQGKRVLFFTLEMSEFELMNRLIAMVGDHYAFGLHKREVSVQELSPTLEQVHKLPLSIVSKAGITSHEIVDLIMQHQEQNGVDVVMVDYLQRLNDPSTKDGEHIRLANIARTMKNAAMSLHVPIITPTQVDKASAKSNEVSSEDVAGSKVIIDEADLAFYLKIKKHTFNALMQNVEPELYLHIVKNRHGQDKNFAKVQFNKRNLRLQELSN